MIARIGIPALLAILLAGCASEQTLPEQPRVDQNEVLQKQLELGVGYLRNGEYQRAKEKLTRALEIDPKSATAHTTFGLVFQLEGEPELAEQYFKTAIRLDSQLTQARNNYGAFLFAEKRYHEAVEQLSAASENRFYPNRAVVFENLGVAYRRIGDMEGADYAFGRAVQLNPDQARALLELAEIRFDQQNYVQSRDFYRRHTLVARQSPRSLWLCIRVARIFRDEDEEASCELVLKNIYPASEEYRMYQESLRG